MVFIPFSLELGQMWAMPDEGMILRRRTPRYPVCELQAGFRNPDSARPMPATSFIKASLAV